MLRIAILTPTPPQRTGIADYVGDLLPALRHFAEFDLFTDSADLPIELQQICATHPIRTYPARRWRYDMAVYQMGNSLFHREILGFSHRFPGVLVLHDETLHHLIAATTAGEGNFAAYVRELAYERGIEGARRARRIREGTETPLFSWPLNSRIVDVSPGTIVHSHYLQHRLESAHPRALIGYVPQPMPLPKIPDRAPMRRRLGIAPDDFVIVTCGGITPEKRLDLTAEAFLRLRTRGLEVSWLIVGEATISGSSWYAQIVAGGEAKRVIATGYVPDLNGFNAAVGAADVCVNLRYPTAGETSASALRALALGLPVIVSDSGWYRELPSAVAVRVCHDGHEVEQLVQAISFWYENRKTCVSAGLAGRALIDRDHAPSRSAAGYVAFIEMLLERIQAKQEGATPTSVGG